MAGRDAAAVGVALYVLDAERLDALDAEAEGSGANPFESTQLVITPLSLIVNDEMRLLDALAAPWDMVIVDEAHHLSVEDGQPYRLLIGSRCRNGAVAHLVDRYT